MLRVYEARVPDKEHDGSSPVEHKCCGVVEQVDFELHLQELALGYGVYGENEEEEDGHTQGG